MGFGTTQHTSCEKPMKLQTKRAVAVYRKKLLDVYKQRGIHHAKKHISRLMKSTYPSQQNDYVMLKIAKHDVPIDAELAPIVKKLVKQGFWTDGVDFGLFDADAAFIGFAAHIEHNNDFDKKRNALIDRLAEAFKKCNVKVIRRKNKARAQPNKLIIAAFNSDGAVVLFKKSYLDAVYDALGVSMKGMQVLPGSNSAGLSAKTLALLPVNDNLDTCEFWGVKCWYKCQA